MPRRCYDTDADRKQLAELAERWETIMDDYDLHEVEVEEPTDEDDQE